LDVRRNARFYDGEFIRMKKLPIKEKILNVYSRVFKKHGIVSIYLLQEQGISASKLKYYWGNLQTLHEGARKKFPDLFKKVDGHFYAERRKQEQEEYREKVIEVYSCLHKKYGFVSFFLLAENDISRRTVENLFGSLTKLQKKVRQIRPEIFFDVALNDVLTPEKNKQLAKVASSKKIFIVTSAAYGGKVDPSILAAMENFCRKNDAEILVQAVADPAAIDDEAKIDRVLTENPIVHFVASDVRLNDNLVVSSLKMGTKQSNPLTGLDRLTHYLQASVIAGSPKQFWKTIPGPQGTVPRILVTTGIITSPSYAPKYRERYGKSAAGSTYLSERTAYLAEQDHVMGGMVVEIRDSKIFHPRHIQFDASGSFVDTGVEYRPDGSTAVVNPAVIVAGDIHVGQVDPIATSGLLDMGKVLKPRSLVVHDLFDARSVSPWEHFNSVTQARWYKKGILSLNDELEDVAKHLTMLLEVFPQVVVVASNHDEWLDRYLEKGWFVKDPINFERGCHLARMLAKGELPLKCGVQLFLHPSLHEKVIWLHRRDEFKVGKIHLSYHGDKGPKGARGGPEIMERALGYVTHGHGHDPCWLRGAHQVGTNALPEREFNDGDPTAELAANEVIYDNGSRQMYTVIEGKWRNDGNSK
jgi:hypothetical protein